MKYLSLVMAQLARRKLRTALTMISIFLAFMLFGILYSVDNAFNRGAELSGANRLVTIHKYSITQPLPVSYATRISQVKGVEAVVSGTWFGGFYQDPKNFFAKFPVDPKGYLDMYPEFILPADQLQTWMSVKTGAVVGRQLASRFGWKIGDRIPIEADIWPKSDNNRTWEFDIVGIYDGESDVTDTAQFLFRYDYFDEARAFAKGQVGWYIIRVNDPNEADRIASDIDALFTNSPAETKTSTEEAFNKAFAKQLGDIGLIVRSVLGAVFFTILLVTGNTIAQSVRERTRETGTLKILGFSDGLITTLVMSEAVILIMASALLGLGFAYVLIDFLAKMMQNFLPYLSIPPETWWLAVSAALVLALLTGLPSAIASTRLRIVDALRRG